VNARLFETDKRLWLYLTLALFASLWFCPWAWIAPKSSGYTPPAILWGLLFTWFGPQVVVMLGFYSVLYGIVALAVGWVLHCFVVVVRQPSRDRQGHTA
jgi:hypothetical protein